VLGEHVVGMKNAISGQNPFRHHALPFAEEIGKHAGISHWQSFRLVSDHEANGRPLTSHHTARLDQAAEPEALVRRDLHRDHLARRIEEDN
jgi:hypothetical protein